MTFYERLTVNKGNNPNSSRIIKLFKKEKDSINIGLTKLSIDYDILKIEYSGSDLHTIEELNYDLYRMGLPDIDKLKSMFYILDERGKPNYYYVLRFQL